MDVEAIPFSPQSKWHGCHGSSRKCVWQFKSDEEAVCGCQKDFFKITRDTCDARVLHDVFPYLREV